MASTPLLGLSLPADGTTNWGTLVNTSITALLDSAVAGTTTITVDDNIILSATTEAANESRQAIILWKPLTGTVTRNITAPAQSKTYVVINATGGTQSIVFRGTGPTTGVTIPAGVAAMLAWNGSDFVTTGVTTVNLSSGVTGVLGTGNGGTGQSTYVDGQLLIGNSTGNTLTKSLLSTGTGISVTNGAGAITITNTAPDQVVALTGAGATTITGTYPNFTISSVNTTYGTATSTVPGLIELGSDTTQTTAANAVTSDASRTYAIQLNSSGQAVVNVPWTGGSGGTVTGVGATAPVQSSGGTSPTISLAANYGDTLNPYASKTANTFLAAPNGSAGVPAFRAIVATDIPTLNQNTSGTAAGLSVTLVVGSGGTGATSFTSGALLKGNGSSAIQVASAADIVGQIGSTAVQNATTAQNTRLGGGNVATNLANGSNALASNTTGFQNTATGYYALSSNTEGLYNTAFGYEALFFNITGNSNVAIGSSALRANTIGTGNIAIGQGALFKNTSGNNNTAIGLSALGENISGGNNVAVGDNALLYNISGVQNSAVGYQALLNNTTGGTNNALGETALYNNTTGNSNTALGDSALYNNVSFTNCSGLGKNSQITGSNQVQLGDSATTTYVYGTVQNRSDLRDKADVRDTLLGLSFINSLRPVDYRWDMREDYMPKRPDKLPANPTPEQEAAHKAEIEQWLEACKHENLVHDGSKKRNRYHHGLIAQEVKATLDSLGIDFGGYQDHKVAGGNDVLSIGYDELIAPLIKSIQQLNAKVEALEAAAKSQTT
jgi:hypothetical protein